MTFKKEKKNMIKDENLNRENRADELRNHYEFMGKAFGKSELSRQTFEDLPFPISVRHLSDEDMEELARMVESDTIKKFPYVAEKMFMLWKVGVDNEEEMEFLNKTCAAAHNFYFDTLRWYAINKYDAKHYDDIVKHYDDTIKYKKKNMKQDDKAYMTKTFGRSATTRQDFEDMPYPICTINITDEQMEKLTKEVEDEVISKYPDVAEKMFELWRAGTNTDEEIDFLMNECSDAEDYWWNILQFNALNNYGAKYYEDMNMESYIEIEDVAYEEMQQYSKPTKEDMENAIESEKNKQSQEQIDAAIEDIDIKSAEYKEAAEMMEETKRRADVVELAEKLWLLKLKDLAEYSYYDAFKDAETFFRLKSKYLKEGKIC
jgi:hypothetical protein